MRQGTAISAVLHGGLLAFALFGEKFAADAPEVELKVSEVTLLSEAELMSLGAPDVVSQPISMDAPAVQDAIAPLEAPSIEPPVLVPPLLPDEPSQIPESSLSNAFPSAPAAGDPSGLALPEFDALPAPVVDVQEPPPIIDAAPPPSERVDTTPAPRPAPDVEIAKTEQEEVAPAEDAKPDQALVEQEATAREEASTRIVTEAEESPRAVLSVVPLSRPASLEIVQPETVAPKPPDPEPPQDISQEELIRSAIIRDQRESGIGNRAGAEEEGDDEQLSAADIAGLISAIQSCWNFGAMSTEASRVIVTIGIRFDKDGRPIKNGISRLEASSGSETARSQAYDVAIRAVTNCLRNGYEFPPEKYEQWKQIELTFNPEKMRLK